MDTLDIINKNDSVETRRTSTLGLRWTVYDFMQKRVDQCLKRTNWDAMREIASRANNGQRCRFLPDLTHGGRSLARLLEFDDGTRWVARVRMSTSQPSWAYQWKAEVDTMAFLKANSKAAVPSVHAYGADDDNPTHSAFILMDFLPFSTMAEQCLDNADDQLPDLSTEVEAKFFRSLAAAHVQLASARLPMIGVVTRDEDGNFGVGPIPGIGGPFKTATEYIKAWAATMRIEFTPERVEEFRESFPDLCDEYFKGLEEFPERLAKFAESNKYFQDEGPFPVRHDDMLQHNILVDEDSNVQAVIDWDEAQTVPWVLMDIPMSVGVLPSCLTTPYYLRDEEGQITVPQFAVSLVKHRAYAEMVREAEVKLGADHKLSDTLTDRNAQELGKACFEYSKSKGGMFGQVFEHFEDKERT